MISTIPITHTPLIIQAAKTTRSGFGILAGAADPAPRCIAAFRHHRFVIASFPPRAGSPRLEIVRRPFVHRLARD